LLQSSHPALLATFGWLKPRVLLPADAGGWPIERIRIVLAHELAHVSRRDWLVQLGASIFQAVYWFNPIVWISCRMLRRQSELACDDAVLRLGVEAPAYAGHLLGIARDLRRARRFDVMFPAPAMARQSSLERRVRAMLNTHRNRLPVSRALAVSAALAIVALAVPVAGLLASSQAGSATFSGTVVDTVGHVVPNLSLVVTNRQDRTRREAVSDASGRFEFRELAPGDYAIGIEKPGFARVQGRVVLEAGQELEQDVALQVRSVQETITVTASNADAPPPPPPAPLPKAEVSMRGAPPPPPPAPPSKMRARALREACSGIEIGGCLEPPIKLLDVRPEYPASKRDAGVEAHVQLAGRIGTDGFVKDLRLASAADSDFAKSSMDAVSAWRFAPTRLSGVPIETPIEIAVSFEAR
jgi:TonB family protein